MSVVDLKVLDLKFGTNNERLRQICEATVPGDSAAKDSEYERRKKDSEMRDLIQKRIAGRLNVGLQSSLKNYQLFAAVDLSWDAAPINKETIPLILYAQGKLDLNACADQLDSLSTSGQYVQRKDGRVTGIDLPKFFDVNINLIRSIITRRLAAQSLKYEGQHPYYDYDVRSTSTAGRLYSDVISQVVEEQTDAWGHRQHDEQVIRDTLLYAQCTDFIASSWSQEMQMRFKPDADVNIEPNNKTNVETVTLREGVRFVNPHPTRVFKDPAYPWTSLNTDSGATWCGYWDVTAWKAVADNTDFFNRDKITFTSGFVGLFETFAAYWSQYYTTISVPNVNALNAANTVQNNDAKNMVGTYIGQLDDAATLIAVYFEKVRPIDIGCGTYPYPVWMRLVTSGMDGTVVFAEWLPSRPVAVSSYNFNDSRQVNQSLAMEMMPFQDQLTNLTTQLLALAKSDCLRVLPINTDGLEEDEVHEIEATFKSQNWFAKPFCYRYSGSKLAQCGVTGPPIGPVMSPTSNPQAMQILFQAIVQVIQMAERLAVMSPNESGQPIVRSNGGVTAQEVQQIEATTSTIYSFVSKAIDRFREAKKRIIFESWMAFGKDEWTVPVLNRYPRSLIEANGFKVENDEDPNIALLIGDRPLDQIPMKWTVTGKRRALVAYDYVFTSRDGSERPVNAQAANTLVQLLPIIQQPQILQQIGQKKYFDIINLIFRLTGAGADIKIEAPNGADQFPPAEGPPPPPAAPAEAPEDPRTQQTQQVVEQLVQQVTDLTQQLMAMQKMLGLQAVPGRAPAGVPG